MKQKRDTAIGAKFVPTYSILFLAELEGKSLEKVDNKPYLWWRYRDDIFFIWEHGEEKLRNFLETLNEFHPTIKFTAEWSQKSINFLDVTVSLIFGQIETYLYRSLQIATNTFILPRVTLTIVRKAFRIVKHYALTEFVLRIIFLTFIVII